MSNPSAKSDSCPKSRSKRAGAPGSPSASIRISNSGFGDENGGGAKQFGVDTEEVPRLLESIGRQGLDFEGFHLFAGSQNLRAESICEAQCRPTSWRFDWQATPVRRFASSTWAADSEFHTSLAKPAWIPLPSGPIWQLSSPGRPTTYPEPHWSSSSAAIWSAKPGNVPRHRPQGFPRGQVFLVTDGGLHHHLSASGNFGQVIRKNYPVAIGTKGPETARKSLRSSVPSAPLDTLADRMDLAVAEPGDLVVVFQSGAYGASASCSASFRTRPALNCWYDDPGGGRFATAERGSGSDSG